MKKVVLMALCVAMVAATTQAAFIVETRAGGKAVANASYTGVNWVDTTLQSSAVGMTAGIGHRYASQSKGDATVSYSYTPGVDLDNTVLAAGTALGGQYLDQDPPASPGFAIVDEAQVASGLVGGGSGLYHVYVTWTASTNVNAAGSVITITHAGGTETLNPVVQNTGSTGTPGATNAWLRVTDDPISLNAGTTYTVTWDSNGVSWTQLRSGGVMWEMVPEPATLVLLGLGGLLIGRRRRTA